MKEKEIEKLIEDYYDTVFNALTQVIPYLSSNIIEEDESEINLVEEAGYLLLMRKQLEEVLAGKRQLTQGMGVEYYRGALNAFEEWLSKAN